jgi:hypothetical protein
MPSSEDAITLSGIWIAHRRAKNTLIQGIRIALKHDAALQDDHEYQGPPWVFDFLFSSSSRASTSLLVGLSIVVVIRDLGQ